MSAMAVHDHHVITLSVIVSAVQWGELFQQALQQWTGVGATRRGQLKHTSDRYLSAGPK